METQTRFSFSLAKIENAFILTAIEHGETPEECNGKHYSYPDLAGVFNHIATELGECMRIETVREAGETTS